jgi:hypothetical protein
VSTMGRYCKAYHARSFRAFTNWTENRDQLRKVTQIEDGKEVEVPREVTDDDVLYLQENFNVTDGIFFDENIVFDNVTPEWQAFCTETLSFELPEDVRSAMESKENGHDAAVTVAG